MTCNRTVPRSLTDRAPKCRRRLAVSAGRLNNLGAVELPALDDPEPDQSRRPVGRCASQHPSRWERLSALVIGQARVMRGNRPQRRALVQPAYHQPYRHMAVPQGASLGCALTTADVDQWPECRRTGPEEGADRTG